MDDRERGVVTEAIEKLSTLLQVPANEFPKMMYHADLPAQTVKTLAEQKVLEAEGWTVDHDPKSGLEPHAVKSAEQEAPVGAYFIDRGTPPVPTKEPPMVWPDHPSPPQPNPPKV